MSLQQEEADGMVTFRKLPSDDEVNAIVVMRKQFIVETVNGVPTAIENGELGDMPETKDYLLDQKAAKEAELADMKYKLTKFGA